MSRHFFSYLFLLFALFLVFHTVVMTELQTQLFVKTKSWVAQRVGRIGRHLLRLLRLLAQHNCLTHTHLPVRLLMTCTLRYTTLHIIHLSFLHLFILLLSSNSSTTNWPHIYFLLEALSSFSFILISSPLFIVFIFNLFYFTQILFSSIIIIINIFRSRTLPDELKLNVQCSGTGEIGCSSTQGGVVTSGGGFSNSNDRNRDVSHSNSNSHNIICDAVIVIYFCCDFF